MSRTMRINELFRVPSRFLRSVQLERDFHDASALEQYIVTPAMAEAFRRIVDGLRADSGHRAWRVTGDYGVGKSSFALVLAHLLCAARGERAVSRIADEIGWTSTAPRMWPILLTGARESAVSALARGVGAALRQRHREQRGIACLPALIQRSARIAGSGDPVGLEGLLEDVRVQAGKQGAGVMLVVDELGKLLEHAAQYPDVEDVFVLQRLAEMAVRSGEQPFLMVGLLHQGFQAYAERLPASVRHEWEKVAGRFDEIVFDQPLAHTAALVAGALNIDGRRVPSAVRAAAADTAHATAATGWLGGATTGAATLDASRVYPLHPTLLPVMVRFFARFGQHERSLFGFLLSHEPFGLQAFSVRPVAADSWYCIADFYDYIRTSFGHRLTGPSYRTQWLRIVETIDAAPPLDAVAERVMKAVGVLNLLDAEDLQATERALQAAFALMSTETVNTAVRELLKRGLLFRRGAAGGYRLWANSSINLELAFDTAARVLGPIESVSAALEPLIDREPILARRHYVERGTLRYFEVRVCRAAAVSEAITTPSDADGVLVVVLADTEGERRQAIATASRTPFDEHPDVVVGVSQPLVGVAPEVDDVRRWDWIATNSPELSDDPMAAAEVARQRLGARRALQDRLGRALGLGDRGGNADVAWLRQGQRVAPESRGGLSGLLSQICDQLYPKAPLIANELLNRNTLSSAAAAARMRLIEALLNAGDRPMLGIDPRKAPPEKSMYLSVIAKGRVHIRQHSTYRVVEPPRKNDPLRLRPALDHLMGQVERARGDRLPVDQLLLSLKQPPFGVRTGVAPLLLAILLRTRSHELAVYENGTFLHRFGASDFLRLTKAPATFDLQHCHIKGVRAEVFEQLAATFAMGISDRRPDLLDVVRPLCEFAAQLPEYTRRSEILSPYALAVRDCLMTAREPISLIFRDLPGACAVRPFSSDQTTDHDRVHLFIVRLHDAIGELRGAYPELLSRLTSRVAVAVGAGQDGFDRAALAARAARVSLVAREPTLRTFALRLRDPGLSDQAWVEALGSLVVSKPPTRWTSGDEARFSEEIGAMADLFFRVEAAAFSGGDAPAPSAIRVNLTRGDGEDVVRVIESPVPAVDLTAVAESFSGLLPQDRQARIDLLTRLLWNELTTAADGEQSDAEDVPKVTRRLGP